VFEATINDRIPTVHRYHSILFQHFCQRYCGRRKYHITLNILNTQVFLDFIHILLTTKIQHQIFSIVISVPICPRASRTPGRCAEQQVQDQVVPEVLGGRILCLRAQVQLPARRGQDDVRDCRQGG
jgi:hypothetical protein